MDGPHHRKYLSYWFCTKFFTDFVNYLYIHFRAQRIFCTYIYLVFYWSFYVSQPMIFLYFCRKILMAVNVPCNLIMYHYHIILMHYLHQANSKIVIHHWCGEFQIVETSITIFGLGENFIRLGHSQSSSNYCNYVCSLKLV